MAEGNGLLNRRRGIYLYRGFESRPLRFDTSPDDKHSQTETVCIEPQALIDNSPANGSSRDQDCQPGNVPIPDNHDTNREHSPDKLNDKRENEPAEEESDLMVVIEAWPGLSEPIRSAILALVRASEDRPKG